MISSDALPDILPTPCLLIDERIVRANHSRIASYARKHGLFLRPHFKTHKSLRIASYQVESGCNAFAVAKVEEGLVLAEIGVEHIHVAYPPAGTERLKKLAELARRVRVRVTIDCLEHIRNLVTIMERDGVEFEVLIEVDAGLRRSGVSSFDAALTLAQEVARHRELELSGIQLYLGQLWGERARDPEEYDAINRVWEPIYEGLHKAGHRLAVISTAATPTLFESHRIAHVNEVRVGNALLNEQWLLEYGHCSLENCAARVLSTVVSTAVPGRAMIDAGSKALCCRSVWSDPDRGFGLIEERRDTKLIKLHEELGWLDTSESQSPLRVGERLSILPVLIAPTVALYSSGYFITVDGNLEHSALEARGALC